VSGGEDHPAEPGGPPLRVLIADDQALVRGGFRLILKAAGIEVVGEAADGAQAVEAAQAHRPDVVLMDIRMPGMDGIEATRRILADFPGGPAAAAPADQAQSRDASCCYPDEPPRIIILTTFDLDQYVYAALAAGASGFLLKDVTPEHLVAAVRLVRTGDALLAPSITRPLVERFAPRPGTAAAAGHHVTAGHQGTAGHQAAGGHQGTGSYQRTGIYQGTSGAGAPGGQDTTALTPRELEVLGLVARGMSNAEIAAAFTLSEATVKTHVARILTKLSLRDRVQAVVLAYETGLISPGS
jgi:DNA-binding NarL/FixJ family response regulator